MTVGSEIPPYRPGRAFYRACIAAPAHGEDGGGRIAHITIRFMLVFPFGHALMVCNESKHIRSERSRG